MLIYGWEKRLFIDWLKTKAWFLFQSRGSGEVLWARGMEDSTSKEEGVVCIVCWETVDMLQCNCTTKANANVHQETYCVANESLHLFVTKRKTEENRKNNRKCCLYRTFIGSVVFGTRLFEFCFSLKHVIILFKMIVFCISLSYDSGTDTEFGLYLSYLQTPKKKKKNVTYHMHIMQRLIFIFIATCRVA